MSRLLTPLLAVLLLSTVALADDARYRIVNEQFTQARRDVNGKKVLEITLRFRVEQPDSHKPVTDIDPKQIVITENGRRVTDLNISRPRKHEPLTVVLVVDTSGSMKAPANDDDAQSKIEALRTAAAQFVTELPPDTRLMLLPFSSTVARPEDFKDCNRPAEVAALKGRIERLSADGETALFDAVYTALQTLEAQRAPGRWVVVALTDGIDNSSRHRAPEVIERGREIGVPVYTLGFGREKEFSRELLADMAAQTGGKFYHARDAESLRLQFRTLSEELQPTYTVTFASLFQDDDGTARVVRVRIGQSEGEGLVYQRHGVVVPKMDQAIYLGLLFLIGVLLVVPAGVKRLYRFYGGT